MYIYLFTTQCVFNIKIMPELLPCDGFVSLPSTFVAGVHDKQDVMKMCYSALGNTGMRVSALSLGKLLHNSIMHIVAKKEQMFEH